jgi:SSS family solute:Na+ symporter/sodium/pantothenate symporter
MAALGIMLVVSGAVGIAAQRAVERGSFLKGFFLGNRGLGVWTMALTATVQSGGTFMGVPSLIYSHGWIVALWIGSYMLVPLTGFAVLGKRLGQLSRRTSAITIPDLFRGRFDHPTIGLVTSLLIMFYMSFMMVAQFKAGAILMQLSIPGAHEMSMGEDVQASLEMDYYVGLAVFAVTVVGYTMMGGFLASVWTDLFQSVLMLIGVMVLLLLTVPAAGGLEHATRVAVTNTGPAFAFGPGYTTDGHEFLPIGAAVSMFFVWIYAGMASPASMVRVMASKDTATLRRSIFCLSTYNLFIYIPLICICIAARSIIPDLPPEKSDQIIPRMALWSTHGLPAGSLIAGIILSAPFGAVMATVSAFLIVMASAIVRDVYLRFINPEASEKQIRRMTHVSLALLGVGGVAAVIYPPNYLQALIVFGSTCGASSLLWPAVMACYWRRATAAGAMAAMLGGSATVWVLYSIGWTTTHAFRPYLLWGLEPMVYGLAVSGVLGFAVSLLTTPPSEEHVSRLFDG